MARTTEEAVERIHVLLYKSDINWLRMMYGREGGPGVAAAVRLIVRRFKQHAAAKLEAKDE